MKKITAALLFVLVSVCVMAQTMKLPIDPAVRVGRLDNGLTYYIRHNVEPKGQADFFIAQKVGSMQEEDNQRGLAHFLEHMCFNGTTHFPGKALIEWLESVGVKFGYNLNAYTSLDETVYNISSVPVSRDGIIDSCLLILHDWSHDLLLEDKEIDAERGVIHEEWRGQSAVSRMITNALPQMYPDCRYGHRMPIGTMEVVDHFAPQVLRDYYHRWYRPDLQAIIVVGDIDADAIETKIKTTFAGIVLPAERAERTYEQVADNAEPIVVVTSDKEMNANSFSVMFKSDKLPKEMKNTPQEFMVNYMANMTTTMLTSRLDEQLLASEPPFIKAAASEGDFFVARTKDAYSLDGYYADGGFEKAFKAVVREFKRARDFGFTAGEYDRARSEYLRNFENSYTDRAKINSTTYAQECARHFTKDEPMPGIETEFQMMKMLAPQIPVEAINQLLPQIQPDSNLVILLMNTASEKCYSRDEILAAYHEVMAETLTPYEDKVSTEPLLDYEPQGSVKSQKKGKYESEELTLSNGVRVVMKNTDFKQDEILFYGDRRGGTSVFDNQEIKQAMWINSLHPAMGLGTFSAIDLEKALAGRVASAAATLGQEAEVIQGSCSPRDLRTMLQLCSLHFAEQRVDTAAFQSFRTRTRAMLENQSVNPNNAFSDTLQTTLYAHSPRIVITQPWMMDSLQLSSVKEMYERRFDHADGFTFYLVGNLSGDSIAPMVAQYLGALPVKGVKDNWVDRHISTAKGKVDNYFTRPMEQDKNRTAVIYVADGVEYSQKNIILMDCIEQAVQNSALARMREEIGGTYSPAVQCSVDRKLGDQDQAAMLVLFECDPAQSELLTNIAVECIEDVAKKGPSAEIIEQTRQYLLKNYAAAQTQNSYWLHILDGAAWHGVDMQDGYEAAVNAFTAAEVQQLAARIVAAGNRVTVSMSPQK